MPAAAYTNLEDLFTSLFKGDELRAFLRRLGPPWEGIVNALPSGSADSTKVIHEGVLSMERCGLADADFFHALVKEFPKRNAHIEAVAASRLALTPVAPASVTAMATPPIPKVHTTTTARQASVTAPEPAPDDATWRPVRIVHLSDLHFSAGRAWDQDPILAALVKDVEQLRTSLGELHRVLITGDIANWGKAEEFEKAAEWLIGPLARAAGVEATAIRVVPGNHDVDRGHIRRAMKGLDAAIIAEGEEVIAEIMSDDEQRDQVLRRQSAFLAFAERFHPGIKLPWWRLDEDVAGWRLRLIGLNTAWLAGSHKNTNGDVDDHRHLAIGGWQWNALFSPDADEVDICVALMHHPWEELADWDRRAHEEATMQRCGVVLSGHLHDSRSLTLTTPDFQTLTPAAGACYAHPKEEWPHAWQLLELDPGRGEARIHLRTWHARSKAWRADRMRYPSHAPDGIATLPLRRSKRAPPPPSTNTGPKSGPNTSAPGPNPRALKDYRDSVRGRVDNMPWLSRQLGLTKTLSEVHVRVEVCQIDSPRREPGIPEYRRLLDVLGQAGARWVMLGEPGSGKSTMLRRLAHDLADEKQHWLPVLLHASELRAHEFSEAVRRAWGANAAALVASWPAERLLVLVDGLDEAGSPREIGQILQSRSDDMGMATLIVAGRPEGYSDPWAGFGTLQILPLAETEQERLLHGLGVSTGITSSTLSRMRADRRLREIVARPLLLTLAALVLLNDGKLPDSRAKLYARALDCMLHRRDLNPHAILEPVRAPDDVEEALVYLAPRLLGRGEGPWSRASILGYLRGNAELMGALSETWSENTAYTFLDEIGRTVGILVPQGRDFGFSHRTLGEYLASRGLAKEPACLELSLQAGLKNPAAWAEVLALCVGQLKDGEGDALVRRIAASGDEGRALLHRVLADAEGISSDTVLAVLGCERGWNRWRDRQGVIESIPALVGDVGVAVRLLDRYRRETRDGNDLYWIRETLQRLASEPGGDRDAARDAAESQACLFDHIPAEMLARAKALMNPWWRTVPPVDAPLGHYWVGEEPKYGELSHEFPDHPITLSNRFAMLGVPVTWAMYLCFDPGHKTAQTVWNKLSTGAAHDEVPVYNVSWYAATIFAAWVGARLPLEPEWEIACRAGKATRYWSGDKEIDLAWVGWFKGNSAERPHVVAQKSKPNPWGVHDMHGNVWEWCVDRYASDAYAVREDGMKVDSATATYAIGKSAPIPAESATCGDDRVLRGGSWQDSAESAGSACRGGNWPSLTVVHVGFRLVLPVPEP